MYGLFLILLFYLLGCLISALIGNFVPGSVIGMVLLFAALSLKWVRPGAVKRVSSFLLDNMMLFFVPVGVGLITSYTLLSRYMLAIIVASLVSTVLVIAVVGLVEQKLESKRDSAKNEQKKDARTH
ncbi:MAG TPA: CidA/LrgA family protein [Candidatus Alistipes merdigallinarum]|nr:CidA/LrgA family protein [Candidatus Alistipes merdigallinarum]